MRAGVAARHRNQAGFTLIELMIASALGLMVMAALASVVLTSVISDNTAMGRIEASAQIRNFQATTYDDFVLARAPVPSSCGTSGNPCTSEELILRGLRVPNVVGGVAVPDTVRYAWDPGQQQVIRYWGSSSRIVASNVTTYSWYVDQSGGNPSLVVSMTVTIPSYNATYSESQTLRFYPRITATPSP
jgi:prepilin-type N-terminal cleavage/methylation domain-containing protein